MENTRLPLKSWAEEDRPREKLLLKGKEALSEVELIAILIRSGSRRETAVELSKHIFSKCGNDLTKLARLTIGDLQKFNGIGEAKALAIVAALELGRRRKEIEPTKRFKISSSEDAFHLIKNDLIDLNHEEFWLILMKRNNEVIKKEMLSKGGVSGTIVDSKLVFKMALDEMASGIILAHNHPSGNQKPSLDDLSLTKKLKEAGKSLDIAILDHLIIADDQYFSFADEGIL